MTLQRLALCLEYNGTQFQGWQAQRVSGRPTVQESVETALSEIANHPVKVYCAGRTDSGVHACGQIVHFDCHNPRPLRAWRRGANTLLPRQISVRWAIPVEPAFHARFSALSRRYRYLILNRDTRPANADGQVTWFWEPLNADVMSTEAQILIGEHDFTSFRAATCQSRTAIRNVYEISVIRQGELVVIDIRANAFLHHMVRNIAGVLMAVGSRKQPPGWAADLLEVKNRCAGSATAAPSGLYLVEVSYPENFNLPRTPTGPWFLNEFC